MLYVDAVADRGARWAGGRSCHLVSDASERELLEFGVKLGLSVFWYQAKRTHPHFDLSPSWRARAIAAGAKPVDRAGIVAAVRRFRAANPDGIQ